MDAKERIIKLLDEVGPDGILQSEIPKKLGLAKSTVSEVISELEDDKIVVRKKIGSKSYRIWLCKHSPEPVDDILRVGILKASEYPKVVHAAKKVGAIVKVYDNSLHLTKDLVHGSVDVAASPFVTQAFFGVLMKNIWIVRVVAMNGSGIVFSEGKWFGCSEFSTMERNLRRYMKVKGIDDRVVFFSSPEGMIESLAELKGIAIWEPYVTMLSDERRVELFNEVLGDFVCCTLAVNKNFLETNESIYEEFIEHFDRAKCGRKDAEDLAGIIGFDPEIVYRSFSSYVFDVENEIPEKELEDLSFGGIHEVLRFD